MEQFGRKMLSSILDAVKWKFLQNKQVEMPDRLLEYWPEAGCPGRKWHGRRRGCVGYSGRRRVDHHFESH